MFYSLSVSPRRLFFYKKNVYLMSQQLSTSQDLNKKCLNTVINHEGQYLNFPLNNKQIRTEV